MLASCPPAIALTAIAALTASKPFPLSAPSAQHGTSIGRVAVASNGDGGFLVAWADGLSRQILTTAVDPGGNVLSPQGVPLPGALSAPSVDGVSAAFGTEYLLVWSDPAQPVAMRMTPDGQPMDTAPIALAPSGTLSNDAQVATDGHNFLVIFIDDSTTPLANATLVDASGAAADIYAIGGVGPGSYHPHLTFDGSDYLFTWQQGVPSDLFAETITDAGRVPNAAQLTRDAGVLTSNVLWNGTSALVAWFDPGGNVEVAVAENAAGLVTVPVPSIVTSSATASSLTYRPPMAVLGGTTALAWPDSRSGTGWELWGTLLDKYGTSGPNVRLEPGFSVNASALAANANELLMVWQNQNQSNGVWMGRLGPSLTRLDPPTPVLDAASDQNAISAASSGNDFFAVWTDDRTGLPSTWGALVHADGTFGDAGMLSSRADLSWPLIAGSPNGYLLVLAPTQVTAIPLDVNGAATSPGTAFEGCTSATVVWNGANYVVAWSQMAQPTNVVARRVAADGTVLESTNVTVASAVPFADPSLAAAVLGSSTLVAWVESSPPAIRGARLSASPGAPASAPFPIVASAAPNAPVPGWVSLGADGTNWLAVWLDGATGALMAQNIDATGSLVGPPHSVSGLRSAPVSPARLTWDGLAYLFVWDDVVGDAGLVELATRLDSAGNPLEAPKAIAAGLDFPGAPTSLPINASGLALAPFSLALPGGITGASAGRAFGVLLGEPAALRDGGGGADASVPDAAGALHGDLGCHCAGGPGPLLWVLALLAALAGATSSRRRRSPLRGSPRRTNVRTQ